MVIYPNSGESGSSWQTENRFQPIYLSPFFRFPAQQACFLLFPAFCLSVDTWSFYTRAKKPTIHLIAFTYVPVLSSIVNEAKEEDLFYFFSSIRSDGGKNVLGVLFEQMQKDGRTDVLFNAGQKRFLP